MPQLKFRDPADGLWKPVPVGGAAGAAPAAGAGLTGGAASYDVGQGAGITVAADAVALDTAFTDARYVLAPLPAPPTIPAAGAGLAGGVTSYDVGAGTGVTVAADTVSLDKAYTDSLYSPVTHAHALNDLTDADTVASAPAVGDALVWDGTAWVPSGPAVVVPPTPALITQAARWADGIPRFVNAAARDAAYLAIGGPQEGMRCWLTGISQEQQFSTVWAPSGGRVPTARINWGASPTFPSGEGRLNYAPSSTELGPGMTWDPASFHIVVHHPGVYQVQAHGVFTGIPAVNTAHIGAGETSAAKAWGSTMTGSGRSTFASSFRVVDVDEFWCAWYLLGVSFTMSGAWYTMSWVGV